MKTSPLLGGVGLGLLWFLLSAAAWLFFNTRLEFIYINF
jgi:hypothetical protein